MARLRRAPQATIDADEIWMSIAVDSESAADRLLTRMDDAEQRLADFPHLGRERPDIAPDARSWGVGNYLILYRIAPDAVEIIRILHGARDLGEALDEA
ncbi:type II toxin-antitoxin system RelE/ParE family toxin [Phenylobacterium aquaticum]|uniref:type II toxin-antitoxin system RelE/ParE family toxin n=1 Tax=Phenylobacterium aquaticum TaxID=1763816 RepID=UPI0026EA1FC7|nr:type II toxin-antitoxin system RelE/ParE family toxin [Phenylobacterium aquaticum]